MIPICSANSCARRGHWEQRSPNTSPLKSDPNQGLQSPTGDSCRAKCPESANKPLERGHCSPCPLKSWGGNAFPGGWGKENAPRWGVLAPVSPWANGLAGPGLCWSPQSASFCRCLEGTQQQRAAKSGWTLYGRLLVALPTRFCWFKGCR